MAVKVPSVPSSPGGPPEPRRLRDVLSETPLSPGDALRLAARLCDALEAAHAQGLVHGRLRPDVILWTPEGALRIVDFGVAPPGDSPYAAPEVRRGGPATPASDLFSMGVLLYELLARRLPTDPFEAPSGRAGTSLLVDDVIRRALDPDPARRPRTPRDIRNVVAPPPPLAPPSEWSGMKIPWIAAGVLCLFVLLSMGLAGWRIKQGRRAARLGTLESEPPTAPQALLRIGADGLPGNLDSFAPGSSLAIELDPGAPERIQKELLALAAQRSLDLHFVAGDARFVRLRVEPGQSLRIEDYQLLLGPKGDMLTVLDRDGVRCVDFIRLQEGDLRRWQDFQVTLTRVAADGFTVDVRSVPGGTCFGAGNYLKYRTGLRVELPGRRLFTIETYDPASLELRASFEGEGSVVQRTLAPRSETRLLGLYCRYRPDPADAGLGLILTED